MIEETFESCNVILLRNKREKEKKGQYGNGEATNFDLRTKAEVILRVL